MSTDLSIGSAIIPTGVDKVYGSEPIKVKQNDIASSPPNNPRIGNIQGTKELKLAKIQGQNITVGDQEMIREIEKAVQAATAPLTTFDISIHKGTNELLIKVLNKDTGELIREIPPEQTLNIVANLRKKAGIVVDARR